VWRGRTAWRETKQLCDIDLKKQLRSLKCCLTVQQCFLHGRAVWRKGALSKIGRRCLGGAGYKRAVAVSADFSRLNVFSGILERGGAQRASGASAPQRLGPGDRARSPSRRLYEPEVLGCTSTLPENLWFLINEVSTPSPQTAEPVGIGFAFHRRATAVPPSSARRGNAFF
jgi:hypothetical protein